MANGLAPIPNLPVGNSHEWREWFFNLWESLGGAQGQIFFTDLNFTGSNITDIQTRAHNTLQGLQGGNLGGTEYYHLDSTQYATVAALTTPSYGSYQNTADQTFAAVNTPYIVTLNTIDYTNNQTLTSNRITAGVAGMYNLEFSFQLASNDTSIHEFDVWLRKNGTDVSGTSSIASVPNRHGGVDGYLIMAANFYIQMAAGDYVELWCAVSNTNIRLDAIPAQTSPYARPLTPSSVVTLTQIGI